MAFYKAWTEITPEAAKELWNTKPIFAYDESQEVDWQLNAQEGACMCQINEAVEQGAILFVENEMNINL